MSRSFVLASLAFGAAALLGGVAPALADSGGGSARQSSRSSAADVAAPLADAQEAIEAGDFEAALEHLAKARRADPRNADVENLTGYSHRRLGDYETAVKHYERALRFDRKHRGALEYLGQAYLEMGEREKARKMLERLEKVCRRGCKQLDMLRASFEAEPGQAAAGAPPAATDDW